MAIRINLLAEAQALEELRRRDPVKRLIMAGVAIGVAMLGWSGTLYLKADLIKSDLNRLEGELRTHTNDYQAVLDTQKKLNDVTDKLDALRSLTTNRFLNGNMLDALQKATLDDAQLTSNVQITSLRTEHTYIPVEGTKARTNSLGRVTSPAKPPSVTEKLFVTIEAKDISDNPGDLVGKYREALGRSPYFRSVLSSSNDVVLKGFLPDLGADGKKAMKFTLTCRYPDKARSP